MVVHIRTHVTSPRAARVAPRAVCACMHVLLPLVLALTVAVLFPMATSLPAEYGPSLVRNLGEIPAKGKRLAMGKTLAIGLETLVKVLRVSMGP